MSGILFTTKSYRKLQHFFTNLHMNKTTCYPQIKWLTAQKNLAATSLFQFESPVHRATLEMLVGILAQNGRLFPVDDKVGLSGSLLKNVLFCQVMSQTHQQFWTTVSLCQQREYMYFHLAKNSFTQWRRTCRQPCKCWWWSDHQVFWRRSQLQTGFLEK